MSSTAALIVFKLSVSLARGSGKCISAKHAFGCLAKKKKNTDHGIVSTCLYLFSFWI